MRQKTRFSIMFMAMVLLGYLTRAFALVCHTSTPRPLIDMPDWVLGMIVLAYENQRHPDARLLYARASCEWAQRQTDRAIKEKLQADLRAATET